MIRRLNRHAMTYDVLRDRVVLFGGDDGSPNGETWEWRFQTEGPAVEFHAALPPDVLPQDATSLRVHAHCGGRGALDEGATLLGWSIGGPHRSPGTWGPLGSNQVGVNSAQPYLPTDNTAVIDWTAPSAEEARRYIFDTDRRMAFRCGVNGTDVTDSAQMTLDYLEVRLGYRTF